MSTHLLLLCTSLLRFLSVFTHLLASNSVDIGKIRSVNERQVEVVNVWRLQKLLLGQLTIEIMQQSNRLFRDLFKGGTYKAAESLVTAITEMIGTVTD